MRLGRLLAATLLMGAIADAAVAKDTLVLGAVLEPPHLDPTAGAAAAIDEIVRLKPSSSKGRYVQKGAVSTTFGPGIPLDVNALV